jgi:hypothetical protein
MSLRTRHLASLHRRRKISFSTIRHSNHSLFRWLFSIVFWRFCEFILLSFWFENSFQEFSRSFSSFLRSIFIQSNEILRSDSSIHWMSAFCHISTIDSWVFDSKVSLIFFLDQLSRYSTIFFAMLQMLHELFSLWLAFKRFVNDFEILLKDLLLTSKIFFDSSRDWESFFYQTQMTNSSCATNWENRTHIDRSERQTNSVVLSLHRSSLSSTIIDSFVDVWMLVADLYICEQSRVFEFDSSTRNVSLELIIFDESFSDFWDKSNWIDQLTSVWKCSDFSEHRFSLYIYASDSYNLLEKSRDHVARRLTNQSNWSHRFWSWKR